MFMKEKNVLIIAIATLLCIGIISYSVVRYRESELHAVNACIKANRNVSECLLISKF